MRKKESDAQGRWQCSRCKDWKASECYDYAPQKANGLYAYCKTCRHEIYIEKSSAKRRNYSRPAQQGDLCFCTECKDWLTRDCFDFALSAQGTYTKCKKCRAVIARKNYEIGRLYIKEVKAGGCRCCDIKHENALEFHHTQGRDTYRTVTAFANHLTGLKKELSKCVVLCANHHNLFHSIYGKSDFPDWSDEIEEELKKIDLYENNETSAACSK